MRNHRLAVAGAVLICAFFAAVARADSTPVLVGDEEDIWKKSQSLRPQPSMDSTPISVNVGNVFYRIPRNYIWNLHFTFPVLKATYPGFKPLTEETRGCFDPTARAELGCTSIELNLRHSLPNKARFDNLMKLVPSEQRSSARRSIDGYQVYNLGPENARQEIYRSDSEDILFTCKIFDNNGARGAVCDDIVSLTDGNAVWFFFHLNQISELRRIESGIRQLMSQFQVGDSK